MYILNASFTTAFFFPCVRFNCLYFYLVSLHYSSNHGARCLVHLFGFFWSLSLIVFITPACCASLIINSSTLLVLISLSWLYYTMILLNSALNLSWLLCSFHLYILSMYNFVSSFPIHSYLSVCFTGGPGFTVGSGVSAFVEGMLGMFLDGIVEGGGGSVS